MDTLPNALAYAPMYSNIHTSMYVLVVPIVGGWLSDG